jgi:hypothetical protein
MKTQPSLWSFVVLGVISDHRRSVKTAGPPTRTAESSKLSYVGENLGRADPTLYGN